MRNYFISSESLYIFFINCFADKADSNASLNHYQDGSDILDEILDTSMTADTATTSNNWCSYTQKYKAKNSRSTSAKAVRIQHDRNWQLLNQNGPKKKAVGATGRAV